MLERLHPSGAGRLLDTCPRKVRHGLDYRTPSTAAQLNGTAVHSIVYGGPEVVGIDQKSWSKTANEQLAEVQARGGTGVLEKDLERVRETGNRCYSALFNKFGDGTWSCEKTVQWSSALDVACEGTPDLVIELPERIVIVDLKTTADITKFWRSIADYHYDLQLVAYGEAIGLTTTKPIELMFLATELTAPNCTRFITMSDEAVALGQVKWETAQSIWRECLMTGEWPDYDEISHEPKPWEFERFAG